MDAKERRIRKTLRLLIIVGVVMTALAAIFGLLGFSGNATTITVEPPSETVTEAAVPESAEQTVLTTPEETSETVSIDAAEQLETEQDLELYSAATEEESIEEESAVEEFMLEEPTVEESMAEESTAGESLGEKPSEMGPDGGDAAGAYIDRMSWNSGEPVKQELEQKESALPFLKMICRIISCTMVVLVIIDGFLIALIVKNVKEHQRKVRTKPESYATTQVSPGVPVAAPSTHPVKEMPPASIIPGITLGKVHCIGRRDYQQDSFGQMPILQKRGVLAILADGMGGLENGERVSQRVVIDGLNFGAELNHVGADNPLTDMLDMVNRSVNQMLGPEGLYKSGSTLVSVLVADGFAHWISVGDSRIYLFRDRYLSQVTRDHDLLQRWMPDILAGRRSLNDSLKDMDGRKLTSFIGMGDIQYMDQSRIPLRLQPGDRLLLMSDGIYGSISDAEMENLLRNSSNVQAVAAQIEQRVAQAALPYQDNYTLMILGFDPAV